MSDKLTLSTFQEVLPKQFKGRATQEFVDKVNLIFDDPTERELYRDNLLSFASVLKEGKFKLESYVDAVRYMSFKLRGDTNKAAYIKTFPDRYQEHLNKGVSDKDISSYIAAYNKSILVNKVREQTLIPSHILNADMFQAALNKQYSIMNNEDASFKVQSDAANSILTHLKQPETSKLELEVTHKEGSAIDELRDAMRAFTEKQMHSIKSGNSTAHSIAKNSLFDNSGKVINE